jgi:catechol 2,3-dioxygenase-like lactoylglutathione lyase family enzyme
MFSHIMIGSNDIARSKKFYDALFVAMGGQPGTEDARGRLAYAHNGGRFMVSKPIDGKPASQANGGTIGFTMSGPEQADAWHKAGVAMAARRPRTRPACAKEQPARCIWLIFAIPTVTSCARFIACQPELSRNLLR